MELSKQYFDTRFLPTEADPPLLPFFHCCDARYLQGIIDKGMLEPRPCKVFEGERLLYLFYGRPAYKSPESLNSRLLSMMPVCFILKPEAVKEVKRILPFDSGGFNFYEKHLHNDMKLEEFLMTPETKSLTKTVGFFYEDNSKYFEGVARKEVVYDSMHFQVESYHSMLVEGAKELGDDRKMSMEVQIDYEIPIHKDFVSAIILPQPLLYSEYLKRVKDSGIELIGVTNYGVAQDRYYVHLLDVSKEYLLKNNLLNGSK